ncbi:DNA replication complex GINS protein SLD5 [Phymastichus coffea]|uniref:DNA replication complex GINS protein SLD5 n=1 Tax=Phymastichus coffea TaxID=108790 RepID=UPI00273C9916|nr:DNA replication complex GINS protein SLD5 [Phymastichus coffea]
MEIDESSPTFDMYEADPSTENIEIVGSPLVAGNIDDDSDNEQGDEMSCAQALQSLENAWLNEKFAPELLPHQQDLVDFMLETITYMENNIKKCEKGDIRINIHTMENRRIRFIISSYLRKRLDKIEEYAIHLLTEDNNRSTEEAYMTPAETKFAREYLSSVENLFTTVALQHMPDNVNNFDIKAMASKPNMDKHVFVRANKTINGILIAGNEDIDFEEDSQHIVQYSAIAHLVKNGDVQLI